MGCLVTARVGRLEQLEAGLLDERQTGRDVRVSKECAARLWQSTHCISKTGRAAIASGFEPEATYVRVPEGELHSTHGIS